MTTHPQPLTRFLLPVDVPMSFERSAWLMGTMTAALGDRIEKIAVLHVMAGRYLSSHMANVDVRTRHVIASEQFQMLKKQHVSRDIAPKMEEAKKILEKTGITAPIELLIEDGDPIRRITDIAARGYSTVIMERRGLSAIREVIVGSVTSGLLHRDIHATVYLVGQTRGKNECPASCCLIPVDGSSHSREALREASILISHCTEVIKQVALVHVINLARYGEEIELADAQAESADRIMTEANRMLVEGGVPAEAITQVIRYGDPADIIEEEIRQKASCMVFMGRRGRNALGELFMGSVSRKIIHRFPDHFVALVSEKK